MSATPILDAYLARLEAALRRSGWPHGPRARRALEECRAHLLEARAHHRAEGVNREEAELRAVAAFGDPDTIARAWRRDNLACWRSRIRRTLVPLTLLTALGAVAVLLRLPWHAVPRELFATGQAVIAGSVLAHGALTLAHVHGRFESRRWVQAGAWLVLALGLASAAWSAAAAIYGPDPEYWAVLLASLVVAQGGLALFDTSERVWRCV